MSSHANENAGGLALSCTLQVGEVLARTLLDGLACLLTSKHLCAALSILAKGLVNLGLAELLVEGLLVLLDEGLHSVALEVLQIGLESTESLFLHVEHLVLLLGNAVLVELSTNLLDELLAVFDILLVDCFNEVPVLLAPAICLDESIAEEESRIALGEPVLQLVLELLGALGDLLNDIPFLLLDVLLGCLAELLKDLHVLLASLGELLEESLTGELSLDEESVGLFRGLAKTLELDKLVRCVLLELSILQGRLLVLGRDSELGKLLDVFVGLEGELLVLLTSLLALLAILLAILLALLAILLSLLVTLLGLLLLLSRLLNQSLLGGGDSRRLEELLLEFVPELSVGKSLETLVLLLAEVCGRDNVLCRQRVHISIGFDCSHCSEVSCCCDLHSLCHREDGDKRQAQSKLLHTSIVVVGLSRAQVDGEQGDSD